MHEDAENGVYAYRRVGHDWIRPCLIFQVWTTLIYALKEHICVIIWEIAWVLRRQFKKKKNYGIFLWQASNFNRHSCHDPVVWTNTDFHWRRIVSHFWTFYVHSTRISLLPNHLPFRGVWLFIWNNLNPFFTRILCIIRLVENGIVVLKNNPKIWKSKRRSEIQRDGGQTIKKPV